MLCPSCVSSTLKPVKLQPGLPARQCRKCNGILIALLSYREWAESFSQTKNSNFKKLHEVADNSQALICAKCSNLMLKFRVAGSTINKIDVCTHCDDAWLDYGEWELLGSLALQGKLNAIFTEPWQRKIREEVIDRSQKKRFIELFGSAEYNKLSEIKDWINAHVKKSDVIRFLLRK